MPIATSMLAIALGAALGANLRWVLALMLNSLLPALPLGTLAANWLGAWLIGIAMALFTTLPELSALWRLFVITGFLGALTTFSTFSAEVFNDLQAGRFYWGFAAIVAHVAGSLVMTGLGMATFALLRQLAQGLR